MRTRAESPEFELVHFVEGFVDGVLNGTADFQGAPHHFVLCAAAPNRAEVYRLTPLSVEAFGAVTEAWEIWRRWERAQRDAPNHPAQLLAALPEDRERQAELRGFISNWLAAAESRAFLAEGDFQQVSDDAGQHSLRVRWNPLDVPSGHLTTD